MRLFSTLVSPILTYCSEVWGPLLLQGLANNTCNIIAVCNKFPTEGVLLKFARYLLGVNNKSSILAVRGELGLFPLVGDILRLTVKYWSRIRTLDSDALVKHAYLDMYSSSYEKNWAKSIKAILQSFDMDGLWFNQGSTHINRHSTILKKMFERRYSVAWANEIDDTLKNPKLRTYKEFKRYFSFENYLLSTKDVRRRTLFTKLRISAHRLNIELGRHAKPKVPPEKRVCLVCKDGIEDETHFVMHCKQYMILRADLFRTLGTFTDFSNLDVKTKFSYIMSYNNGDSEIGNLVTKYIADASVFRDNLLVQGDSSQD